MATITNASDQLRPMAFSQGGTASSSYTNNAPVVCNGSGSAFVSATTGLSTSGLPFVSAGSSSAPTFTTLTVGGGGTGRTTSTTAYGVLCAGTTATGAQQTIASVGTSGQVLTSNGAGALPTFQTGGAAAAGTVIQVLSATKTDTFTTSSTTPVDVTGLSVAITPGSASNKIMVFCQLTINGFTGSTGAMALLLRDATSLLIGDVASSRSRSTIADYTGSGLSNNSKTIMYLDSPATTAATTYKIQAFAGTAAAIYINRSITDTDSSDNARVTSTITVMEVKG